jgi:hypothetical protein
LRRQVLSYRIVKSHLARDTMSASTVAVNVFVTEPISKMASSLTAGVPGPLKGPKEINLDVCRSLMPTVIPTLSIRPHRLPSDRTEYPVWAWPT